MEKKCYVCGEIKSINDFHKDKSRVDGLCNKCKVCAVEKQKEYGKLNKGRVAWKENVGGKKCYVCGDVKKVGEFHKNRSRSDGLANICKLCKSEENREYRRSNEEARKKRNQSTDRYRKKRRQHDHAYRMLCNMRMRVYEVLRGNSKSAATLELVGCSYEDLVKHMESQFTDGMTWVNYGEWHVDHVRPCASFDLSDPEQQKQCFHYTNLQPLWAEDNIAKGDTWLAHATG